MKRGKFLITIIFLFISLILLKHYDFSFKNFGGKASFGTTSVEVNIANRYDVRGDEFDKIAVVDEDGDIPTNFTNMTIETQQNISNIIIREIDYGKIEFLENINISSPVSLDTNIEISHNLIEINSTALPNFNKSANLKIYNLKFTNPRILKDGIICPKTICTITNYSNGILSFNVTHFTSYSSEEIPSEGESSGPTRKTEIIKREIKEPEKPKIISEMGKLFNISILIPEKYRELVGNDSLIAEISIINIRKIGVVDVNIEYLIEDSDKDIIYSELETKTVENELDYIKEIKLPEEIKIEEYMLIVKVRYKEDIALAGYPFKIIKEVHIEEPGKVEMRGEIYILIGMIILILTFIIYKKLKKKRSKLRLTPKH